MSDSVSTVSKTVSVYECACKWESKNGETSVYKDGRQEEKKRKGNDSKGKGSLKLKLD